MTNAQAYGMRVVATNPFGEQPLSPYSVCNLSAINLANFVDKNSCAILYDKLSKSVEICVRLQDNVIDATPYFLEANKKQALGERRIGLGVMGLHDLLIWSNLKYGSKEANKVVDKIFKIKGCFYICVHNQIKNIFAKFEKCYNIKRKLKKEGI